MNVDLHFELLFPLGHLFGDRGQMSGRQSLFRNAQLNRLILLQLQSVLLVDRLIFFQLQERTMIFSSRPFASLYFDALNIEQMQIHSGLVNNG